MKDKKEYDEYIVEYRRLKKFVDEMHKGFKTQQYEPQTEKIQKLEEFYNEYYEKSTYVGHDEENKPIYGKLYDLFGTDREYKISEIIKTQ